jgi:hypothetical protein
VRDLGTLDRHRRTACDISTPSSRTAILAQSQSAAGDRD